MWLGNALKCKTFQDHIKKKNNNKKNQWQAQIHFGRWAGEQEPSVVIGK